MRAHSSHVRVGALSSPRGPLETWKGGSRILARRPFPSPPAPRAAKPSSSSRGGARPSVWGPCECTLWRGSGRHREPKACWEVDLGAQRRTGDAGPDSGQPRQLDFNSVKSRLSQCSLNADLCLGNAHRKLVPSAPGARPENPNLPASCFWQVQTRLFAEPPISPLIGAISTPGSQPQK